MLSAKQQAAAWAAAVAARDSYLATTSASGGGRPTSNPALKLANGVKDGVNRVFTFSSPPVVVFLNGSCLWTGDYAQNGSTITLTNPIGDKDLLIGY